MKVVTRYLLRSHLPPFVFAFVALTGVILINTVARELAGLAGKGLQLSVVLEFFMLSLPANIALTLPMAVLVAVLHAFSTLGADNEITALRASGVDLRRATAPLILAAALITVGMIWFNDRVLPEANYRWRNLMFDVAQTRPLLAFREQTFNRIPGPTGSTPYYLEARELNRQTGAMRGVQIYDVSNDQMTRTITADSGRISQDPSQTDLLLTLYDGQVHEIGFNIPSEYHVFEFTREVMKLKDVSKHLERTIGADYRTDRDMTVGMMRARIDTMRVERATLLRAVGDTTVVGGVPSVAEEAAPIVFGDSGPPVAPGLNAPVSAEASAAVSIAGQPDTTAGGGDATASAPALPPELSLYGVPDSVAARASQLDSSASATPLPDSATISDPGLDRLDQMALGNASTGSAAQEYARARAVSIDNEIGRLRLEIHKKFAIASATLVFVLIGIPTALRFPRGGVGMVMAVSLTIFGIYYVGLIGGEKLSNRGFVNPVAAMWTTNFIFGTVGLIAFSRLGREQGTSRGAGAPILYRIVDLFTPNKSKDP